MRVCGSVRGHSGVVPAHTAHAQSTGARPVSAHNQPLFERRHYTDSAWVHLGRSYGTVRHPKFSSMHIDLGTWGMQNKHASLVRVNRWRLTLDGHTLHFRSINRTPSLVGATQMKMF